MKKVVFAFRLSLTFPLKIPLGFAAKAKEKMMGLQFFFLRPCLLVLACIRRCRAGLLYFPSYSPA